MKSIIISTLALILFVGCDRIEPYAPNGEKESTLRCVQRGSWDPLEQDERGKFPVSPDGLILLKNETGQPVIYDFIPWWGDMDNLSVRPASHILSGKIPKTYITDGDTEGIRIREPFFFRDGALLTLYIKSGTQEDLDQGVTSFDFLQFRRITGEEMRNKRLTVIIKPGADIEILPAK